MKEYYACVALDVAGSRKLDFQEVENILHLLAKDLNDKLQGKMLMSFRIRNGDELIGVIKDFRDSFRVIRRILEIVEENSEIAFYIGCGFGEVATRNKTDEHISNGSAIIHAIEARDSFLKKNDPKAAGWNKPWKNKVFYYTEEVPYQVINYSLYTIRLHKRNMTSRQREIIMEVEKYPDRTLGEIGKAFGYKNPKASVRNHLTAANYQLVKEMEESLEDLLGFYQKLLQEGG
ncbi:hypothetical protein [Lentibacillus sediminis]|uniref:hypothetical protein n=1 Tax=Lentibacillus sediminis TaxID=1940529 RepID=UPI000C1B7E31|nr:hypothetical protein [Lentibacillus sediminis]